MRISSFTLILTSIVVSGFSPALAQQVGSDVPCAVTSPNGIVASDQARYADEDSDDEDEADAGWAPRR